MGRTLPHARMRLQNAGPAGEVELLKRGLDIRHGLKPLIGIFAQASQNDIGDVATGKRTEWKTIKPVIPVDSVGSLKITPDGRAYAYNYTYTRSDLYLAR